MKLIQVKVIANAKKPQVTDEGDYLKVKVNAPAIDGKANTAVIKMLATYLKIKEKQIRILKGFTISRKVIQIIEYC